MNLKEWAEREGVAYVTARRWFASGRLPVPAQKVGGLILVGTPATAGAPDDVIVRDLARVLVMLCTRLRGPDHAAALAITAVRNAAGGGEP